MQFFKTLSIIILLTISSMSFAQNQDEFSPNIYFKGCTFYFNNEHIRIREVDSIQHSTSKIIFNTNNSTIRSFDVPADHIFPIVSHIASSQKACNRKLRHRSHP